MAAGSVIAAMAGNQNLDEMGGFRRAMPFTFGCMVIGGLALAGVPPFSGFFSKDEILAYVAAREDWHVVLAVARLRRLVPDRDLHVPDDLPHVLGRPGRARAGAARPATSTTRPSTPTRPPARSRTPTSASPDADHHIAEQEGSMKVAMGGLAVLATIGGFLQIPGVTDVLHHFLEPTFADSRYYEELEPVRRADHARPRHRHGARAQRHRARLPPVGAQARRPGLAARAPRPAAPLLRQQVVLRRDHRHAHRAAVRVVRALRAQHVRAAS